MSILVSRYIIYSHSYFVSPNQPIAWHLLADHLLVCLCTMRGAIAAAVPKTGLACAKEVS
jgi:hypothetical protein